MATLLGHTCGQQFGLWTPFFLLSSPWKMAETPKDGTFEDKSRRCVGPSGPDMAKRAEAIGWVVCVGLVEDGPVISEEPSRDSYPAFAVSQMTRK